MHQHGSHMKPYQGETENSLQGSSATGELEGIQGMDSSVVSPEITQGPGNRTGPGL